MSDHFYKAQLYPLQDQVLRCMEELATPFYLTGGTALSRYYLHHRYSDDLDFFQNQSSHFKEDARLVVNHLLLKKFTIDVPAFDNSFIRFFIRQNEITLKIELINDVPFRQDEVIPTPIFYRTDSWTNILANKIAALGRNAPKDIADILFLTRKFEFSWLDVIEAAKKKDAWVSEIDASKIVYEFDCERLVEVRWIDQPVTMQSFSDDLKKIAKDILHGFDNSLVKK